MGMNLYPNLCHHFLASYSMARIRVNLRSYDVLINLGDFPVAETWRLRGKEAACNADLG